MIVLCYNVLGHCNIVYGAFAPSATLVAVLDLACSIIAKCDYFITTDKRVCNYKTDRIKIVNPSDFVKEWREQHD